MTNHSGITIHRQPACRIGFAPLTFVVAILCCFSLHSVGLRAQDEKPDSKSTEELGATEKETASGSHQKSKAANSDASKVKDDVEDSSQEDGPAEDAKPTLAIVGATVHTLGPKGTLRDATILISGDRITEVSTTAVVPEDVKTVQAAGMTITPGLIDAGSRLWLTSAAANSTASDASLNVLDGVDPFDEQWHEVIRHGVTSVYVQPGERGTLGGYGAVLSVVPGDEGPKVHKSLAAVQASIGIGASTNQARKQQVDRTIKLLKDAKQYQEKWDKYNAYKKKQDEAKKAAAKKGGKGKSEEKKGKKEGNESEKTAKQSTGPTDPRAAAIVRLRMRRMAEATKKPGEKASESAGKTKDKSGASGKEEKPPEKPDVEPAKERLAKVVSGEIPIRLEINTSDDAYYAKLLMKEFEDLQVVFTGLANLRSSKKLIQDMNAPVVLGPWLRLEGNYSADPNSSDEWTESFADYDGALVISSGGTNSRSSRLLRAHVGNAIAAGVANETALKAVTINAARVLGVDATIGSIEAGKRADIVGFYGSATDASAPVSLVVSGGEIHLDGSKLADAGQALEDSVSEPGLDEDWGLLDGPLPNRFVIRTNNYLTRDGSTVTQTLLVDSENGTVQELGDGEAQNDSVSGVNVGDAWVTPGLISSHATLGLERLIDPRLSDATYVVAGDGVTSDFEGESQLVESGLLRVLLSPSSRNTLSGCSSLIRIGAVEQVVERVAAVKFTMSAGARSADRFPSSLAGQSQLIRESLNGKLLDTRLFIPEAVQRRLAQQRIELLQAVGRGETPALIHASTDADIRAALDLVEEKQLTAWLSGAEQLEPFTERLKALKVGVVARPIRVADYDWYAKDLAGASSAGVPVYFAGENAEQLRLTAALAVESGMDPKQALAGLCYGPLAGIEKDTELPADLVIWSRSPLDLAARPLCVLVEGQVKLFDTDAASDSTGVGE